MNNIAPMKKGQAKRMLICDGADVLPTEAGHWYSPEAVTELILAERNACAMECRNVIVGNENGHYDQITAEECGYQILMRSNV